MSLRDALKQIVARCAPLVTQRATFGPANATGDATEAQQLPAKPHGIRAASATRTATAAQPEACNTATEEKLRVAFADTRNTQPGPLTAHRVLGDLLAVADEVCDCWGDGAPAREEMRQQCLETPEHLRADLLDYLSATYRLCAGGNTATHARSLVNTRPLAEGLSAKPESAH